METLSVTVGIYSPSDFDRAEICKLSSFCRNILVFLSNCCGRPAAETLQQLQKPAQDKAQQVTEIRALAPAEKADKGKSDWAR